MDPPPLTVYLEVSPYIKIDRVKLIGIPVILTKMLQCVVCLEFRMFCRSVPLPQVVVCYSYVEYSDLTLCKKGDNSSY